MIELMLLRVKKWLILLNFAIIISASCFAQNFYLLAGTYTGTGSKGIYVYKFDAVTGKATWVSNTDTLANPSFLSVSGNHVYAVNETSGRNPGKVSSFLFNKKDGHLQFLNAQPTGGDNPCHLAVSADGKWLTVANYSGGNLSIFPIKEDGSLQPYAQLIQHSGNSVHRRQKEPHVHETVFSADNKYLLTPDLGLDKLMIYRFNSSDEKPLSPSSPPYVATKPGSGPRHITFSPNKKFAYVINELNGMVTAYSYNNGSLSEIDELPTSPAKFTGALDGAELVVSPDGNFLYTSQRGEEHLVSIFKINKQTGKLKLEGHQSTLGKAPRNFTIDPTGNYLLVANQNTDNIIVLKRNNKTGLLVDTGNEIKVPKPVCLIMTTIK